MGTRIKTVTQDGILAVQRQARLLGRIRTGWSEPYTKDSRELRRPVKSKTLVLTSQQRACLDAAAEEWGGTVERWQPQGNNPEVWRLVTEQDAIDAILPPGDPLNQTMEMWSGGGCVRRCDGETEKLSGKPCLCLAQFGADFHATPPVRGVPQVCKPFSRLGVFLDLPDFGLWRIETKSYYAMLELAGVVDLLISHLDPDKRTLPVPVPMRLRIDPRSRLKDGKPTAFPVIVIELLGRGIVSQVLSGRADGFAIAGPPERTAIEAGPVATVPAAAVTVVQAPAAAGPPPGSPEIPPGGDGESDQQMAEFRAMILQQNTEQEIRTLWTWISRNNQMTAEQSRALTQDFWARLNQVRGRPAPASAPAQAAAPPPMAAVDGEPNKGALWMQVLVMAGQRGWDTERTEQEMVKRVGYNLIDADGFAMEQFLGYLEQLQEAQL